MTIIGNLSPYALLAISGLLAASDQVVKLLVQQSMAYGESIPVTPFNFADIAIVLVALLLVSISLLYEKNNPPAEPNGSA